MGRPNQLDTQWLLQSRVGEAPLIGLSSSSRLNDDGSVSVHAYVMNTGRQDVKLRLHAFMERIIWDENYYWRDIVDASNSPLEIAVTVRLPVSNIRVPSSPTSLRIPSTSKTVPSGAFTV